MKLNGKIQIVGGNPGQNKVLTCTNNNGECEWLEIPNSGDDNFVNNGQLVGNKLILTTTNGDTIEIDLSSLSTSGTSGDDGVGVTSTVNNGNGTFTINYSDGTSFTTSDLTGPKGDKGDTGADGAIGPKGDKGDTGAAGENGKDGINGVDGAIGPKGDKGDIGLTGPKGDKGDSGADGAIGPKGDTGAAGENGKDGAAGPKGDDGVGVTNTIDNGNGTFTINYSDGSSFTTSDLTGPQGPEGNANDTFINNMNINKHQLTVSRTDGQTYSVDLLPYYNNLSFDSNTNTLTLDDGSSNTISTIDLSQFDNTLTDTNTFLSSASLQGNNLLLGLNTGTDYTVDLSSLVTNDIHLSSGQIIDVPTSRCDTKVLRLTMSEGSNIDVDVTDLFIDNYVANLLFDDTTNVLTLVHDTNQPGCNTQAQQTVDLSSLAGGSSGSDKFLSNASLVSQENKGEISSILKLDMSDSTSINVDLSPLNSGVGNGLDIYLTNATLVSSISEKNSGNTLKLEMSNGTEFTVDLSSLSSGSGGDSDWTVSGTNLYSTPTGYAGIGTDLPQKKLHVKDDNAILRLETTESVGSNYIEFTDSSSVKGIIGYPNKVDALTIWNQESNNGYINLLTSAGMAVSILDQRVGIGGIGPSPNHTLSVRGASSISTYPSDASAQLELSHGHWHSGTAQHHLHNTGYTIDLSYQIGANAPAGWTHKDINFSILNNTKLSINGNDGKVSVTDDLYIGGTVQISGGNPGSGKVLTSDGNGNATWQTPTGGSGSGTDTYVSNISLPADGANANQLTLTLNNSTTLSADVSHLVNDNNTALRKYGKDKVSNNVTITTTTPSQTVRVVHDLNRFYPVFTVYHVNRSKVILPESVGMVNSGMIPANAVTGPHELNELDMTFTEAGTYIISFVG